MLMVSLFVCLIASTTRMGKFCPPQRMLARRGVSAGSARIVAISLRTQPQTPNPLPLFHTKACKLCRSNKITSNFAFAMAEIRIVHIK